MMSKKGSLWADGYCVDGITGSETNERPNIDIEAWEEIGPSETCLNVYNGPAIQSFWRSLFGQKSIRPLVKQTFLRLMGSSGTVQHADYYYFKRDTHVFSGEDGRNAQMAAKQYLTHHDLWREDLYVSLDSPFLCPHSRYRFHSRFSLLDFRRSQRVRYRSAATLSKTTKMMISSRRTTAPLCTVGSAIVLILWTTSTKREESD